MTAISGKNGTIYVKDNYVLDSNKEYFAKYDNVKTALYIASLMVNVDTFEDFVNNEEIGFEHICWGDKDYVVDEVLDYLQEEESRSVSEIMRDYVFQIGDTYIFTIDVL